MGGSKTLHVVCVCTGTKFDDTYVYRLMNAVARHMPAHVQWDFNVLTDRPSLLRSKLLNAGAGTGICIEATEGLQGYWNKLALFQPDLFPVGNRILYLDLDVLVTGSLLHIVEVTAEPIVMMWDSIIPGRWNSSVMMWTAESPIVSEIWDRWNKGGRPTSAAVEYSKGDQAWIEFCLRGHLPLGSGMPAFWEDLVPGKVKPYYHQGETAEHSTPTAHTNSHRWYGLDRVGGASIVVFHGRPRFHENDAPMVREHWR